MAVLFDQIADVYDSWYDTPKGRTIFGQEVRCLSHLCRGCSGRWLEVGVGTGRFAAALGITYGIDLSLHMAVRAMQRGRQVQVGRAEQLPIRSAVFDGVLLTLTLCFLEKPESALPECARVLRRGGRLAIGTIPADSPLGKAYIEKGAAGHFIYSRARFRTVTETVDIVEKAGFILRESCSALFDCPDRHPSGPSRLEPGVIAGAGFVGLLFEACREGA